MDELVLSEDVTLPIVIKIGLMLWIWDQFLTRQPLSKEYCFRVFKPSIVNRKFAILLIFFVEIVKGQDTSY